MKTSLQESKEKYDKYGVDFHEDYIRELEKYFLMWCTLKIFVNKKTTKNGYLDFIMKEVEKNYV